MRARPMTSDLADRLVRELALPLTLAALAALALGTLWSVDAVARVDRHELVHREGVWRERGDFAYEVPVENGSAVYGDVTVLGMGEPGYFTTLSPRILVAFAWSHDDARAATTDAHVALFVEVAPAESGAWTHRTPLANATARLAPGESLRVGGDIDIPAIEAAAQEAARLQGRRLDAAEWRVVAEVKHAREASPESESSRFVLPIEYDAPLYRLPDEAGARGVREHGETRVVVQESRPGAVGLVREPVGPTLAIAGVVGLVALWRGRVTL